MKGILFFDVDGTLIDSDHGREVPDEKVMEAIGRLRRRGYACIVSSGRNMSGLHMLKGIGFDGFVFSDGAGILLEGKPSEVISFDHDEIDSIMKQIIEEYHGRVHACHENGSFASSAVYAATLQKVGEQYGERRDDILELYNVKPLEQWKNEKILEVDIYFENEDWKNAWMKQKPESIEYIDMGKENGEITVTGITKAAGCRRMCDVLGVDLKDCYAFGDSMNDEAMLKECGTGICMGNGDPRLKAAADHVTSAIDEDGLIRAFTYFGLL